MWVLMRGQWIHKNGHVPPSLRAAVALSQLGLDQFQPSKLESILYYTLWLFNIAMENPNHKWRY